MLLAEWGEASVDAVDWIRLQSKKTKLVAIIDLQDFVIGGGEGREEAANKLVQLNVPVLKGLRLDNCAEDEWRLSADGISWYKVHYKLAMPELQGISQPVVLAAMEQAKLEPFSGVRYAFSKSITERV